jgi:hypothetical protein
MPISRRQFFRGFTGRGDPEQKELARVAAIDAYVRTHLLPYDFSLTDEETSQVLEAVRSGMANGEQTSALTESDRRRMMDLADQVILPLREQFWQAEESRRNALVFVREYLASEATPDDLQKIRERFQIPYLMIFEDEVERHASSWLYSLSNARLAPLEGPALRELVFSELKSWC